MMTSTGANGGALTTLTPLPPATATVAAQQMQPQHMQPIMQQQPQMHQMQQVQQVQQMQVQQVQQQPIQLQQMQPQQQHIVYATAPPAGAIVLGRRGKETRRISDPARAQHLWDAIKAVRAQKQIPAITRMSRYMSRFYQIKKDETQRVMDAAVEDNLIKLERKVGTKGAKSGIEENAYRLPTSDMLARDRHDWYCFHCHSGGEVMLCEGCHRVYHESCVKREMLNSGDDDDDDEEEDLGANGDWLCSICKNLQSIPDAPNNKRDRKDLNHLLRILCKKLREKLPDKLLLREVPLQPKKEAVDGGLDDPPPPPAVPEVKQELGDSPGGAAAAAAAAAAAQALEVQYQRIPRKVEEIEPWRATFLLKQMTDLNDVEEKCNANQFRVPDEFLADVQQVAHCYIIYHGVYSPIADKTRQMLRDCTTDIKELRQCRDCYRYSHDTSEKYWFCLPCRPFHDLVYAKQKGFPYWPAKVVGDGPNGTLQIRFFGGYHQKATVDKGHLKPITVNIHTLQVKRTSLWNKACEELRKHQELVSKVKSTRGEEDFIKDPYGDPFSAEDLKAQLKGDNSSSEDDSDDPDSETESEMMRKMETKLLTPPSLAAAPVTPTPPPPAASTMVAAQRMMLAASAPSALTAVQPKLVGGKKRRKDDSEDMVSSSGQDDMAASALSPASRLVNASVQTQVGAKVSKKEAAAAAQMQQQVMMQQPAEGSVTEKELKAIMEKMRAEFDQEKKRAVNVATRSLERDLERLKADHSTEIEEILENHKTELSETKKIQWCLLCEREAMYWCCWNTAYCSKVCQKYHWHKEHKKSCRRPQEEPADMGGANMKEKPSSKSSKQKRKAKEEEASEEEEEEEEEASEEEMSEEEEEPVEKKKMQKSKKPQNAKKMHRKTKAGNRK